MTMNITSMWLCHLTPQPSITLTLSSSSIVHSLRIWNYNHNQHDSYCGVKLIKVFIDGCLVTSENGILVRRGIYNNVLIFFRSSFILHTAPGHLHYDYSQLISLVNTATQPSSCDQSHDRSCDQSCDLTSLPTGCILTHSCQSHD